MLRGGLGGGKSGHPPPLIPLGTARMHPQGHTAASSQESSSRSETPPEWDRSCLCPPPDPPPPPRFNIFHLFARFCAELVWLKIFLAPGGGGGSRLRPLPPRFHPAFPSAPPHSRPIPGGAHVTNRIVPDVIPVRPCQFWAIP